ncbi:hypothetical protein C8Q77DRAFT_1148339 [Trametes polyzona]|nr:hypothetical protein C8Q77DRAFT_1148339 [Trametes polyzona]
MPGVLNMLRPAILLRVFLPFVGSPMEPRSSCAMSGAFLGPCATDIITCLIATQCTQDAALDGRLPLRGCLLPYGS